MFMHQRPCLYPLCHPRMRRTLGHWTFALINIALVLNHVIDLNLQALKTRTTEHLFLVWRNVAKEAEENLGYHQNLDLQGQAAATRMLTSVPPQDDVLYTEDGPNTTAPRWTSVLTYWFKGLNNRTGGHAGAFIKTKAQATMTATTVPWQDRQ